MNSLAKITILIITFIFVACVNTPSSNLELLQLPQIGEQAAPGKSNIEIYRSNDYLYLGVKARVVINGERVTALRRGESFSANFNPGKFTITTDGWGSFGRFRVTFNTEPDTEYLLEISPRKGLMRWSALGFSGVLADAELNENSGPFKITLKKVTRTEASNKASSQYQKSMPKQQALSQIPESDEELDERTVVQRQSAMQRMINEYGQYIKEKMQRSWIRPIGTASELSCTIEVRLIPSGEVIDAQIVRSSGNPAFDRSVEAAVFKASPLPVPPDREVMEQFRSLRFQFKPDPVTSVQKDKYIQNKSGHTESIYGKDQQDVTLNDVHQTEKYEEKHDRVSGNRASPKKSHDRQGEQRLVKEIQRKLKLLGYDPGPIDGVSGQSTVYAVKRFQTDTGLPVDGRLTKELLGQLDLVISVAAKKIGEPAIDETGSGFFVNDKGYILTNHHVIDECVAVKIVENGVTTDAEVHAIDKYNDLALLKLPETEHDAAYFSQASGLELGEKVMTAGYPLRGMVGSGLNVTTGVVSSLSGPENDKRIVQISAPVQPGNSGGPLLDSSGNVAGVVVAKFDVLKVARLTGNIPENVGFGIKGLLARTFLGLQGIDYRSAESTMEIDGARIANNARKFTVAVECWK